MTDELARRVVLATMDGEMFRFAADNAAQVAAGAPVMEDFGFTPDEIKAAERDRKTIAASYERHKKRHSFWYSAVQAKIEWLTELK